MPATQAKPRTTSQRQALADGAEAVKAAYVFDQAAQLALLAKIAAGVDEAANDPDLKTIDRKNLALAAAILVDKTRLILGEVTDRTETLTPEATAELQTMRERARVASAHLLALEAGAGGEAGAGVEVVDVPAAEDEGRAH